MVDENVRYNDIWRSTAASAGAAWTEIDTPPPLPAITGISPSSGPSGGGTTVIITGTRFTGASAVDFGSDSAASFSVDSDTQITAESPGGFDTVDVLVTTSMGTSEYTPADEFTYLLPPLFTSIIPATGPTAGGSPVLITGEYFTGATAVTFGGTEATAFWVLDDTHISAITPAHTAGSVSVTITAPGGTVTEANAYIFANNISTFLTVTITQGQSEAMAQADYQYDGDQVGAINSTTDYMTRTVVQIPDKNGTLYTRFVGVIPSSNATFNPADNKTTLTGYDYGYFLAKRPLEDLDLSLNPVPNQTGQYTGRTLVWKSASVAFKVGYYLYGATSKASGKIVAIDWITNTLTLWPASSEFVDSEELLVGGTLYAYADGHSVDIPYGYPSSTPVYPENWFTHVCGGTTGYLTSTGVVPYKIVATTHDTDEIWDTDPVTDYVIPAVSTTYGSKQLCYDALKDMATYLRRLVLIKLILVDSTYFCGMYCVRQSQIDDATYGLDLPTAATIAGPDDPDLDGGITLAQVGDNQVERVILSQKTITGFLITSTLPLTAAMGPERIYYDEPANVRTQEDLDNLCSDLYDVYSVRVCTWTATLIQRPDLELYQKLTISGYGTHCPDGTYRIVKIAYTYGVDGSGNPINKTQVWFVSAATFYAQARLGWTYTNGIIDTQRIARAELNKIFPDDLASVLAVNSDGTFTVQNRAGTIYVVSGPTS